MALYEGEDRTPAATPSGADPMGWFVQHAATLFGVAISVVAKCWMLQPLRGPEPIRMDR